MDKTKIEWADATWNPVRGCSRISAGCGGANHAGGCYAEKIAARFSGPGQAYEGYARMTPAGGTWTGKMGLVPEQLMLPIRWKRPRVIFVNSMSDLFHEGLPESSIDSVYAVMALAPWHHYMVLTKRAKRMMTYTQAPSTPGNVERAMRLIGGSRMASLAGWPLPNVLSGVSVEGQDVAHRVLDLLNARSALRFISVEPLISGLDLTCIESHDGNHTTTTNALAGWQVTTGPGVFVETPTHHRLDGVILGGESGPRSRPCNVDNLERLLADCQDAGVPAFVKQLGAAPIYRGAPMALKSTKGKDMMEWPAHLRVREMPGGIAGASQ